MENDEFDSSAIPTIDYFEDVGLSEDGIGGATLERLTALANEAKRLESEIIEETEEIGKKQGKLEAILKNFIPTIMEELGMEQFKLKDGSQVEVKKVVHASISDENKPDAFKWLEEHDFDGIIKTKVLSSFGKGEIDDAKEALETLQKAGFEATMDRSIHAQTLKAFVRERLEEGDNIPVTTFGVFEYKLAKITLPRRPKRPSR
jgi:nucleoid DNA-binding protein